MIVEEGKIRDFEDDWQPLTTGTVPRIYFRNKKHPHVYRIIDMAESRIIFSDMERIEKIIDINKVLVHQSDSEILKKYYLNICNSILDDIEPITMPYTPERYYCYIENFPDGNSDIDNILGILYFRSFGITEVAVSSDGTKCETKIKEEEMIPAKKFFRIHTAPEADTRYEEIDFDMYNKLKRKWMEKDE